MKLRVLVVDDNSAAREILQEPLRTLASHVDVVASGKEAIAAVQKHVAVLERAGLLTKRRHGREQLASGDVVAIRSVASMLDELEDVWRGRIARIDDLLNKET